MVYMLPNKKYVQKEITRIGRQYLESKSVHIAVTWVD